MMLLTSLFCPARLLIGDNHWMWPAIAIGAVGTLLTVLLNYRRLPATGLAAALRVIGWLLVTACLVNPLWSGARPRQGANVFAVVVDNSLSQTALDRDDQSRADRWSQLLEQGERTDSRGWLHRIDEHFELHRYTISNHLQRTPRFDSQDFDGQSSRLNSGLTELANRFRGQPLAGILLLTDGNATDDVVNPTEWPGHTPVYPVKLNSASMPPDLAIQRVSASQSDFDDAPVSVQVLLHTTGVSRESVRTSLMDADGNLLESQLRAADDDSPVRFKVRPTTAGTVFYRVHAELQTDEGLPVSEATDVNNTFLVAVDRGSRPRRILYVSGRPNWEFKFLRRAIETDPQTELVGLIRIARKEAKFEFRGRSGERSNSLFRGFEQSEQEVAEEYDEPVLVRLGTNDDEELMSGFPEEATDLFQYDALILDDIEADFFSADQQQLIREFVARRGGGLLMLGGQESFRQGGYDRTPIGETLPVDLRTAAGAASGVVRLNLTREGWLQPWVRLRSDEEAEFTRLQAMPSFHTLNPTLRIRPGAQLMATVSDAAQQSWPALVIQRFGRGRSVALCVGDLWRWRLHEARLPNQSRSGGNKSQIHNEIPWEATPREDRDDYSRSARQLTRWLVSDVPLRLDVSTSRVPDQGVHAWRLSATVRGPEFEVREDAAVMFDVIRADGTTLKLPGRPANDEVGRYDAEVSAGESGLWHCKVTATLERPEKTPEELTAEHGWVTQPEREEMSSLQIDRSWMQTMAEQSGGRVVRSDDLDSFVDRLQSTEAPMMEFFTWPIWHQWSVFFVVLVCLGGDWTIRRRMGYP